MKIFRIIIAVLLVIAFIGVGWVVFRIQSQSQFEEQLLSLRTVSAVEKRIGSPAYVLDQPGKWFADGMVESHEFDAGVTVRVYMVQKAPPRFLVLKVGKSEELIEASRIETS